MTGRILESTCTDWQGEFHGYDGRIAGVVGGLASGKSHTGAEWLIDRFVQWPLTQSLVVGATRQAVKNGTLVTLMERMRDYLGYQDGKHYRLNLSDLTITITRGPGAGHKIVVSSVANNAFRSLKSSEFDTVLCDEVQEWDNGSKAFDFIVGRRRNSPRAISAYRRRTEFGDMVDVVPQMRFLANPPWSTTHWLHKRFIAPHNAEIMSADGTLERVKIWRVSTFDNYLLPNRQQYIEDLRRTMSLDVFRIEVLGESGDIGVGRVYTGFFQFRHVARGEIKRNHPGLPSLDDNGHPMYEPSKPLKLLHDFGVSPRVATIVQEHELATPVFGFQAAVTYVLGEISIPNGSTDLLIDEFVRRYPLESVSQLEHYGDASGINRNSTTGESDWGMLRDDPRLEPYNAYIYKRTKNPPIVDRTSATNRKLLDAIGNVGVLIHPSAEKLIEDLQQTHWIEGTRQIDHGSRSKELYRSHWSDSLGYYIEYEFPVSGGYAYAGTL